MPANDTALIVAPGREPIAPDAILDGAVPLRGEYDSDQGRTMIYRAFFRYAESLLFADPHTIWWLWDDGEMTGLQPGQSITPREGHTARLFGWDDLLADNGE